jgi:broad specificity phosphatase PhoE
VVIVEELRELNVGNLDGRSGEEAWALHDQVLANWQAGRHDSAFPREDYHQAATRLDAALRNSPSCPDAAASCSSGTGRYSAPAFRSAAARRAPDLPNCGVAELEPRPAPGGITGIPNQWRVMLGEGAS